MTPPSCDVRLEHCEEFLRFVGLLREDIRGLAGIGAEVVELELVVGSLPWVSTT